MFKKSKKTKVDTPVKENEKHNKPGVGRSNEKVHGEATSKFPHKVIANYAEVSQAAYKWGTKNHQKLQYRRTSNKPKCTYTTIIYTCIYLFQRDHDLNPSVLKHLAVKTFQKMSVTLLIFYR